MKHTEFEQELEKVLQSDGQLMLPNVKEIQNPLDILKAIAGNNKLVKSPYRFKVFEYDPPLDTGQKWISTWYPKIFLNLNGMGSRFDGSGTILVAGHPPRAFTFHMCEHSWDESGANHSRGWHPKVCTKCGFNASIDSGD